MFDFPEIRKAYYGGQLGVVKVLELFQGIVDAGHEGVGGPGFVG